MVRSSVGTPPARTRRRLTAAIAAIPFIKMLTHPSSPNPLRFVGLLAEGAAQPVGSSGQGTIRLAGEADE
jgi:hypothetical protein